MGAGRDDQRYGNNHRHEKITDIVTLCFHITVLSINNLKAKHFFFPII